MQVLAPERFLPALRRESARFREALADADPTAPVPTCPAWRADDLLHHLASVQHFWARVVSTRPAGPEGYAEPARPGTHEELLAWFDESHRALVGALEDADPSDEAWTWSTDHSVGFVRRRQAHEALIHRLDAELTTGRVTPMDPELATDGVLEALDVMFGGCPPWGEFAGLPHHVRVDTTDTGASFWVQLGRFRGTDPDDGVHYDEDDISVVDDPGTEPDAVVEGPAAALDAWLWRRGDDSEVRVRGDRTVYGHFRLAVNHPIN